MIGDGAVMAHSGMKQREATIEGARQGDLPCLVATSLADEGLDVRCLSVLVMACGGRAEGRTEQRVGRVMRPMEGKPDPWVFDFTDSVHFMLAHQSRFRASVYQRIGIEAG